MKRILMAFSVLILVFVLTACDDVCVGPDCITGESGGTGGTTTDSIIKFPHLDGHGSETEKDAYILFEFESLEYVKYQIAYLSCTCRDFYVNYWQVAYIVIDRSDSSIQYISFGLDDEDHYIGGMWGDSDPIPTNNRTLEDFENEFFPWIVGKTSADFEGIYVFSNEIYHDTFENTTHIDEQDMIDDFAGSSVSTNNIIRIVKVLLDYHEENYN